MQEVARGGRALRSPRPDVGRPATARRGALAACAVLALLIHVGFLGGVGGFGVDSPFERGALPLSIRTIASEPVGPAPGLAAAAVVAPPEPVRPAPAQAPRKPPRQDREPSLATASESLDTRAGARIEGAAPTAAADVDATASSQAAADAGAAAASGPGSPDELSSVLAAGEEIPPVYRTRLPPSATLRYQVRRGLWLGTGEIRWRAAGEAYQLSLEARISGLTLMTQKSEGAIDESGLAPVRFLDQRARRPPQAANFRRDVERITFSGPAVEWPLLRGSQDRLSWMIQLAGIAAADPGLLVEGGKIAMVVVGARGEAALWTLRFAGHEDVQAAGGTTRTVKLVREARSGSETGAEIWLDPARDYLPMHATMRNRDGAVEYELRLERVEPGP